MKEELFKKKIDALSKKIVNEDQAPIMQTGPKDDSARLLGAIQKYQSVIGPLAKKIDTSTELENFVMGLYNSILDQKALTASEFKSGLMRVASKLDTSNQPSTEPPSDIVTEAFTKMKNKLVVRG